jgi:hypothetical protein
MVPAGACANDGGVKSIRAEKADNAQPEGIVAANRCKRMIDISTTSKFV